MMTNRLRMISGMLFVALPCMAGAVEPSESPDTGLKWRLGVQAYTFNRFSLFESIDKVKSLGLKYIEAYPGQRLSKETGFTKFDHHLSPALMARTRNKLDDTGVKLVLYGVVSLTANEAESRKIFDFAKLMGVDTLTADPDPDSFDLLDKLTAEYRINVAIHNHPKPSRYFDPGIVLKAIESHSKRIGACADIGHWVRSGIIPVDAIRKLEGRVISLHLKDLNEASPKGHDTIWGTGKSDVKGIMTELQRQKFSGVFSIEYEYNWYNSVPDLAECAKYFNQVRKELGIP